MKTKVWVTKDLHQKYTDVYLTKPTYKNIVDAWIVGHESFVLCSNVDLGISLDGGPTGIMYGELEVKFKEIKQ